jgi:hypothetical protein
MTYLGRYATERNADSMVRLWRGAVRSYNFVEVC